MASSKKSTTNSTQTGTTTPNVPDWLLQPAQGLGSGLSGFIKQGPDAYTPQISDLQKQAWNAASGLTPSDPSQPNGFGEASNMVRGTNFGFDPGNVNAASAADNLAKYENPYRDQILNPVLNDYDIQAGKTRAAQAASGAANGAFRGDRFALREGATEGELARGRASTEGGLLSDMFKTALGASQGDAALKQAADTGNAERSLTAQTTGSAQRLQGAGLLGNLTSAQGADTRANIDTQNSLGAQQSGLLTAIKQFPLEYQQKLESLFTGLDPSLFTGQTINTTGTSTTKNSTSLGGLFGDMLIAAASSAGKAAGAGGG